MLPLFCAIVAGLCGLVVSAPAYDDKECFYTTKYDHVDIEMILNNRRLVNYYAACMINKGPCPPEGLEFKKILPHAIRTNCNKCTDKQKATTIRAIKRLRKEYPKQWAQLVEVWDPDDIYVKKFIDTYNNWEPPKPETEPPLIIFNRFGDDENDTTPSAETVRKSTEPTKPTSKPTWSTKTTTSRFWLPPIPTLPPTEINPLANSIGQGIKATVSLGSNIVGQVIKGIGDIGNTVVKTGAEIGNRVVKTGVELVGAIRDIARPLQRVQ